MEDRKLPITVGQGAGAAVVSLDLPAFTLIGATTRAGLLTTPLRDRFGVTHRLELYEPAELARIVLRSAGILEVEIDDAGAEAIAARSRGTPRVANRLLKRVRDFAEVRGTGHIDARVAAEALDLLEVDSAGLDRLDREILARSAPSSAAARSASARWRSRWGRSRTRSRTSTSPICSSRASSSAPREGGSRPTPPSPIWASRPREAGPRLF